MNNCIIDIECDHPCKEFFEGELCPCLRANALKMQEQVEDD